MKSKITWCLASVFLLFMQFAFAQQKTITGTVTDSNGMPLPGVNILIQSSNVGTQTDFDGKYWQACDTERAYPADFVRALTDAGYLSALIPEEFGGLSLPISAGAATSCRVKPLQSQESSRGSGGRHNVRSSPCASR